MYENARVKPHYMFPVVVLALYIEFYLGTLYISFFHFISFFIICSR